MMAGRPWYAKEDSTYIWAQDKTLGEVAICNVFPCFPDDGRKALIAAAPEQHELLIEAINLVPRVNDDDPIAPALADWLHRVRAVVKRSKGDPNA